MQVAEFDEFKAWLVRLCAGFDVPYTKVREQAFWTSFARMSLHAFRACVEYAIGPDYRGESFPTTGAMWRIHKAQSATEPAAKARAQAPPDHLEHLADRLLWLHISHRGGLGSTGGLASPELQACIEFKRGLVAEFCGYIREGDDMVTPAVFIRWWLIGLGKISTVLPRTTAALYELSERPESQRPFEAAMARELGEHEAERA